MTINELDLLHFLLTPNTKVYQYGFRLIFSLDYPNLHDPIMADENSIQSTLINFLGTLSDIIQNEENQDYSGHEIKKIRLLYEQIPRLDATLFEVAATTARKHGQHLQTISDPDIELIKRVDFALYFISQSVIERQYRVTKQVRDSAYEIFEFHANDQKDNNYALKASLGSVLLDIIAEESESIKADTNLAKEELTRQQSALYHSTAEIQEDLNQVEKEVSKNIEAHRANIEKQNAKINEDIKRVKDMKSELNFLALGNAFKNFIDNKRREKSRLFWCLVLTGALVIAPPFFLIANNFLGFYPSSSIMSTSNPSTPTGSVSPPKITASTIQNNNKESLVNSVLFYAPFTLLEIFFVFYFRIFLKQYNSVNAQLLQLNMRLSVCQFIESYAQFKKDSDNDSLEKFEALIFSNLMPSADQVPSTFDGMDQLANLLKSKS